MVGEKRRFVVHSLLTHVEAATVVAESIQGDCFELVKFIRKQKDGIQKVACLRRPQISDGSGSTAASVPVTTRDRSAFVFSREVACTPPDMSI